MLRDISGVAPQIPPIYPGASAGAPAAAALLPDNSGPSVRQAHISPHRLQNTQRNPHPQPVQGWQNLGGHVTNYTHETHRTLYNRTLYMEPIDTLT
jgi:hypothetical protein